MPPCFQTKMCGFDPRMRSRSSPCRPVIRARAITSAMTPTMTPSVEMSEMTEMNACLRLASRYLSAICSSKGTSMALSSPQVSVRLLRVVALRSTPAHQREQDDVTNRRAVGQQHDQPVDADPLAGGRRQPILERADVVLVHRMRFEVAAGTILQLLLEPAPLLDGIVELAEGIRHLEPADVEFEPLHGVGVVGPLLGQ